MKTTKTAVKSAKNKKTVSEIIVERLVDKIKENKKMPWQKAYLEKSINYYTKKSYNGINRLLLVDGYYITINQLKKYNKENNTSFWIIPHSNWEYICFYNSYKKEIPKEDYKKYPELSYPGDKMYCYNGYIFMDDDFKIYKVTFYLRYYTVYNVNDIVDKDGNHLPDIDVTNNDFVVKEDAENIVNNYCDRSGVKVTYTAKGFPYYREKTDTVNMIPKKAYFSSEKMYRDLFHELIHSTGIEKRLNRNCFKLYSKDKTKQQRSKEELIAEIGSLLLATQAGFTEEYDDENSDNYIMGWIEYLKNNPNEVISAMSKAEKAAEYILYGTSEKEVSYE